MLTLTPLVLAAFGVGGILLFLARRRGPVERAGLLILPPVVLIACLRSIEICLDSPWSHWNAARLAPAIAILRGLNPYCSLESGSIQTSLYPPGSYLAYLPSGLAESPTTALLIGNVLAQAFVCLGPFLLFALAAARVPRRAWIVILGAAFFVLFGSRFQPMPYHLSKIHADGPALFFAVLACGLLYAYSPQRPWCLRGVAACVILSAWSKQTLVPGLLAIPFYAWWLHGRQVFTRLVSWMALFGIVTGAGMLLLCPFERLFFQTVTLPSSFGFKPVSPGTVLRVFLEMGWPTLVALAAATGLRIAQRGSERRSMRDRAREEPILLLLLMAVCLTPMSLLAWAKYGGHFNSFHNLYFIQIATVCTAIGGAGRLAESGRGQALALCTAGLVLAAAGAAFAVGSPMLEDSISRRLEVLNDNSQQRAYDYALDHPGETLFPWNPLSNLMAEGRLDHMDRAVADWKEAGLQPTPGRLLESIPPSVTTIAYPPDVRKRDRFIARQFGRKERPDLALLPGWAIFALPAP